MGGAVLESLAMAYKEAVAQLVPENEHEWLLRDHALIMMDRLVIMVCRRKLKYVLTLSLPEKRAFIQFWNLGFSLTDYEYAAMTLAYNKIESDVDNGRLTGEQKHIGGPRK